MIINAGIISYLVSGMFGVLLSMYAILHYYKKRIPAIGYFGAFFITISFIPQVIKSYKTKSVGDLSLFMIIATLVGTVFWLIYGIMIISRPIIALNSIFGLIVAFQLFLKIRYRK